MAGMHHGSASQAIVQYQIAGAVSACHFGALRPRLRGFLQWERWVRGGVLHIPPISGHGNYTTKYQSDHQQKMILWSSCFVGLAWQMHGHSTEKNVSSQCRHGSPNLATKSDRLDLKNGRVEVGWESKIRISKKLRVSALGAPHLGGPQAWRREATAPMTPWKLQEMADRFDHKPNFVSFE
jgi:hypothetical protein